MWDKYKHIISHISVGSGVISTVADWIAGKYRHVLVVCDTNTYKVAAERVIGSLMTAGISVTECRFIEDEPLPDEYSVGYILAAYSPDVDLILGVGSGTINDLCTFAGTRIGCASAIVGTAPSMDGYASLVSAMLFDGIKVSPPTQCPVAIFCDIDILAAAPMHMIAAGLGDMLGKLTSLADWRLSHILTGEEMPSDIYCIMESALNKIIAAAPNVATRDLATIQSITEGLILSGIAMSLYRDSRPASGTEHHIAHFWEMRMLAQGKKPDLHGIKVGLAAVIGLEMWRELASAYPDSSLLSEIRRDDCQERNARKGFNAEKDIRRLYGRNADTVMQTQNPNLSIEHIKKHWTEILEIARSLPAPEDISDILSLAGMQVRPSAISLDAETLRDSIIYARERKKLYTLLQLLGDLGALEDYAVKVERYFSKRALSGIKCFVLDMDGTIYLGDKLFSYTHDFLRYLSDSGIDYVFFTNNSSQNAAHYISKLRGMGIDISDDKLLMSTHVLIDYLKTNHNYSSVFIAGTKALRDDFSEAGYTLTDKEPEFAVLGFDTDMDYIRLTKLCDFIRGGVPVYGVNMDYNCPIDGGFIPDCGSLAAAVERSTGVRIEFFGKPSRYALDYIVQKTGYSEDELCFIGDRLYTDIAIASGTRTRSVLVLSGETKREDLSCSPFVPDLVADDLRGLM